MSEYDDETITLETVSQKAEELANMLQERIIAPIDAPDISFGDEAKPEEMAAILDEASAMIDQAIQDNLELAIIIDDELASSASTLEDE